jgi:hypothetical protein
MLDRPAPPPDRQARRRQRHREAMRRSRRRERAGTLVITLPISVEQVAKLHALQYLTEIELEDRARVAKAIGALLDAVEIG